MGTPPVPEVTEAPLEKTVLFTLKGKVIGRSPTTVTISTHVGNFTFTGDTSKIASLVKEAPMKKGETGPVKHEYVDGQNVLITVTEDAP